MQCAAVTFAAKYHQSLGLRSCPFVLGSTNRKLYPIRQFGFFKSSSFFSSTASCFCKFYLPSSSSVRQILPSRLPVEKIISPFGRLLLSYFFSDIPAHWLRMDTMSPWLPIGYMLQGWHAGEPGWQVPDDTWAPNVIMIHLPIPCWPLEFSKSQMRERCDAF